MDGTDRRQINEVQVYRFDLMLIFSHGLGRGWKDVKSPEKQLDNFNKVINYGDGIRLKGSGWGSELWESDKETWGTLME